MEQFLKLLREYGFQPINLYIAKMSLKYVGRTKMFSEKHVSKNFVIL